MMAHMKVRNKYLSALIYLQNNMQKRTQTLCLEFVFKCLDSNVLSPKTAEATNVLSKSYDEFIVYICNGNMLKVLKWVALEVLMKSMQLSFDEQLLSEVREKVCRGM